MNSHSKIFQSIVPQLCRTLRRNPSNYRSNRTFMTTHSGAMLGSKFTVRDPHTALPTGVASVPLTVDRAFEILMSLKEEERTAWKQAMMRYESKKLKDGFEGVLAGTRWRGRFSQPHIGLGDVDPTGSYCAVPDEWLKKKSAERAIPPSTKDLWKIFLVNAVPFIGFGFLDNFTMIVAGDYIESVCGMYMCISTMAAAGLGNTISDVLGIGSAYYIERMSEMLGLRPPDLTPIQLEMKSSRRSANVGRIFGITLGCVIGMFPLLFMDTTKKKHEDDDQVSTASATSTGTGATTTSAQSSSSSKTMQQSTAAA